MSTSPQPPGPESESSTVPLNDRPPLLVDRANNAQEHSDTQRSLQQASAALEVAYNRVRQVRRSLLQLSSTLPNSDNLPHFSINYNEVRPGHEALVLSGEPGDTSEGNIEMDRDPRDLIRLLTSVPPSANHLPNVEQGAESGDSYSGNDSFLQSNESEHLLFQPISPPNVLPPRFSRREFIPSDLQYFTRRGIGQDSASTLRGLRVAAREAQGRETRDDMPVQSAEQDRILRGETDRDGVLNARAERQIRLGRNHEGRRAGPSPPLPPPPTILSSWRAPDSRRWRTRPPTSRPFNGDPPERPTSSTFDSVAFTPQFPRNVPRVPLSTEVGTSSYEQYRSAQEPDARADPAPSNVVIDWSDEDFISWLFHSQDQPQFLSPPRQPPRNGLQSHPDVIRITRTTNTAVSPPDSSPPRRGWGMFLAFCPSIYYTDTTPKHVWTQMGMKYQRSKRKSLNGPERLIDSKPFSETDKTRPHKLAAIPMILLRLMTHKGSCTEVCWTQPSGSKVIGTDAIH